MDFPAQIGMKVCSIISSKEDTMSSTFNQWETDIQVKTSRRALQEEWIRLELKPKTLLHLQYVLDTWGPGAAATVTEVLVREKKARLALFGREWAGEELRILSREGMRPVLLSMVRLFLESLAAWGLIHLSESALDVAVEIILAVLFIVTGFFGLWMASWRKAKLFARKTISRQTPQVSSRERGPQSTRSQEWRR
jgi:hypothetical protein